MSSSFIVIDEIEEALNSVSSTLSTSISNVKSVVDTINTNVNTVKTNVATILTNTNANNTASTSGTLSQKISSAISNTAATTTENSSGTLSAKLTYLINRRERFYIAGSTNLKTVTTSLTSAQTVANQTNSNNSKAYSSYTDYVNVCFDGLYRIYCTGYATVVSLETNSKYGPSQLNHAFCEVSVNDTVVSTFLVATQGDAVGSCASATKTVDVYLKKADRVRFRMASQSEYHDANPDPCVANNRCSNVVTATTTEISIRGTMKEVNSIFY